MFKEIFKYSPIFKIFYFFKLWKFDNTFTGDLKNKQGYV